jgi:hypothetical protein
MKSKKKRQLKVYGQSNGYNYENVPAIILKGKWLSSAGFQIGSNVDILVERENFSFSTHPKRLLKNIDIGTIIYM